MAPEHPRRFLATAAALLLLGFVSACGQGTTVRLAGDVPANRVVLEGIARVRPGVSTSIGSMTICLTKPGRATITSVEPLHPVGRIVVQAYAVRPSPFMQRPPGMGLADETGPLSKWGFSAAHVVNIVCGSRRGAADELGIQVVKPSGADVGAGGWVVTYTSAGQTSQLTVPLAVKLCSDKSADSARCRRLNHYFLS